MSNKEDAMGSSRSSEEVKRLIMPTNDDVLEMEELEGLVNVNLVTPSNVGSGSRNNLPKNDESFIESAINFIVSRRYTFVGLLVLFALISSTVLVEDEKEVERTEHMEDIEFKQFETDSSSAIKNIVGVVESEPSNDNIIEDKEGNDIDASSQETIVDQDKDNEEINNKNLEDKEAVDEDKEETVVDSNTENDGSNEVSENADSNDSVVEKEEIEGSETKEELIEKWGKWTFWDGEEEIRPEGDYCAKYPNRDIPGDEFPEDAWQTDAVYVNHFLDAASNLLYRAEQAIYTEYGLLDPNLVKSEEEKVKLEKMFHLQMVDLENGEVPPNAQQNDKGGWTTKKSFEGLARRLLHAMMTGDTFTVVMAGHSSAAGHGNHFKQSYMMAFHHMMKPIFDRLGVTLITRNIAYGGLGTLQSGLGAQSIFGDDIDMIIWDSGMTEKEKRAVDLLYRQTILGSKRVPFLWGDNVEVLKMLHHEIGADVGQFGSGMSGVIETIDENQVSDLPWAIQFLKCEEQSKALCQSPLNKYRTQCWIDRDDVVPSTKQNEVVSGRASWHPGWRYHQLKARVIGFAVITALQDAVNIWSEITITQGFPLDDSYWHVTEYYKETMDKLRTLKKDPNHGFCEEYGASNLNQIPARVCQIPMQARSEFTPRNDPSNTSIVSIIQPASDGYVPHIPEDMLYDGPDVPNPFLEVPDGEIDLQAILMNRRRLNNNKMIPVKEEQTGNTNTSHEHLRRNVEEITPGIGWSLDTLPGECDGTYDAICDRSPTSNCLLSGHMDHRGGVLGDGLSGWLVMNLKEVKHGIIIIKLESWHKSGENERTKGWTEENNHSNRYMRRTRVLDTIKKGPNSLETHHVFSYPQQKLDVRTLKTPPPEYCDDFKFEYAIDGKITSLDKDEYKQEKKDAQRVVELLTLLDDEEMAKENKERDVQIAIRLTGCARVKTFKLTHVYWA